MSGRAAVSDGSISAWIGSTSAPSSRTLRLVRRRILAIWTVTLLFSSAAHAFAAEPPNQNDPCSKAGRDSCDTTGKGFYKTYEFGIRWFGDYRGAIADQKGGTFCIDLRYWYPSPDYKYESRSAAGLKNRDGGHINREDLARMSYALWNYGRSNDDEQQAATMLYVHSLMRDGAPGEITAGAAGTGPERIFHKISDDAARYAGPYRIEIKLPGKVKVGEHTQARIRVLSASGRAVPDAKLKLSGSGVSGLGTSVDTGNDGATSVGFTPSATKFKITGAATNLAAALPKLYVPTTRKASRNGQRLVAPQDGAYKKSVTGHASRTQAKVKTTATPGEITAGKKSSDLIRISGVPADWQHEIKVRLYGPYASRDAIDCSGAPFDEQTIDGKRGKTKSPGVHLDQPGFYAYRIVVPSTSAVKGLTTKCGESGETVKVLAAPEVSTQISSASGTPGLIVTDSVLVTGLAGQTATVKASLFGPFASTAAIECTGTPFWSGSFTANGDGTYVTDPVQLDTAGYYTYHETIAGQFVKPGATECGETVETTIVRGAPKIKTEISDKKTKPGSKLSDKVKITGLGSLSAPVKVKLWGPYDSKGEIDCTGNLRATQTFTAHGDGTYRTRAVKLDRAGYYTYRERIEATDAHDGAGTECAEGPETTITKAAPKIKTIVSNDVVKPGSKIRDKLRVSGLGKTPAKVDVELFGPFSQRSKINCSPSQRFARQELTVKGDGRHLTAPIRVKPVGFYTYREAIAGSRTVGAVKTKCSEVPETSLSRPLIVTGRGDPSHMVHAKAAGSNRPKRVIIDKLGINAPTSPVGIARKEGILGIPGDIDKTGWWVDGGRPGTRGATLIAGHVDSAKRGAGAFFRLKDANKGDEVKVALSGGGTKRYRVVSVDEMRKAKLPASVFSTKGRERLVLVTCGGPFQPGKGHYRDNIVLTAVPAN
jgi:hypothetical protein